MTQYGFHFDGTRCTGCKTCVLACKDKNNLPNDLNFRNVYEYGGGTWSQDGAGCWIQDTFTYHVSVACNHCDMPVHGELPLRRHREGSGHRRGEKRSREVHWVRHLRELPYSAPRWTWRP